MKTSPYKYSYKFPKRSVAALSVYNTGRQKCAGGYSWGPGVRDHYLLHYVISGKGIYRTGDKVYHLGGGDLFLAYPDQNIYYCSDENDPWEYCWVGFNGTEAPLLLEQTDFSPDAPAVRIESNALYEQMMQIYVAQGSLPHQGIYMTGALYQLLSILIRDSRGRPRQSLSASYVTRACDYIANHFGLPIGVEDIAAHVGLSRSRLYRTFQQEMHISPVKYLAHFRIRQACALLDRRDLSIKAVAHSVGFDNQLYFSRRFREIMKMSPTEYVQSLSGD